jgi:integrase
VRHHPALSWKEIGEFMPRLAEMEGFGARALEFAILTAARSGEVRLAVWDEIDLEERIWTVPATRMKARKEHIVPLSTQAVDLLKAMPRIYRSQFIFTSIKQDKPLSDMSISAVCKRMGVDAVPHGFRSTFRDWCAEATNYPRDVAEMALAHTIASKVEAAYRRGDLLDKRRGLMQAWADFIGRPYQAGRVIEIRRASGSPT